MEEAWKERWKGIGTPDDPEEIQRGYEIDQVTFLRAEMCAEESKAEKEARKKGTKIVAEELEELLVKTPVEKSLEVI